MLRSATPVFPRPRFAHFFHSTPFYYKIINLPLVLVLQQRRQPVPAASPILRYTRNIAGDANLHWQLIYDGERLFTIKSRLVQCKVIDIGGATKKKKTNDQWPSQVDSNGQSLAATASNGQF